MTRARVSASKIIYYSDAHSEAKNDLIAIEEPLEIKLGYGSKGDRKQNSLAITMRTPGHDQDLALGFLFTENIIAKTEDLTYIDYCKDKDGKPSDNIIRAEISDAIPIAWEDLQRNFFSNSSCGICGKASLENLEKICLVAIKNKSKVAVHIIHSLSDKMRAAQAVFEHTGGLHAAALFSLEGELLLMREDVGRHNAMDKLVGAALLAKIKLEDCLVMLSGRSSFELIQKAVMAKIPIIAAIGAPSSLAVETAEQFNITLMGFTRKRQFNVYSHPNRIFNPDQVKSL